MFERWEGSSSHYLLKMAVVRRAESRDMEIFRLFSLFLDEGWSESHWWGPPRLCSAPIHTKLIFLTGQRRPRPAFQRLLHWLLPAVLPGQMGTPPGVPATLANADSPTSAVPSETYE